MIEIKTFPFEKSGLEQIKSFHYGLNWPVVYIQEDGFEMYVGQTTNLFSRTKQHSENPQRTKLKRIHVLTDDEFNLSSAFDFESLLIQYFAADGLFKLQNGNGGLINHNYYDKERYLAKLETLWPKLKEKLLAQNELHEIRNSEFFKYSPYKALTEEQIKIAEDIESQIVKGQKNSFIINGGPGTGKTILALYLLKYLKDSPQTQNLKTALVVSMTGLRTTLQRVLKRIPGMGVKMVIGPSDLAKEKYDLLIVDESHRLRRRVNLTNFPSYDSVNQKLGLGKESTQLDWILAASKKQVFFYDSNQNIVPGDVRKEDFQKINAVHYTLNSQMRVTAGDDYLSFVDDLLNLKNVSKYEFQNYEFKMYDSIHQMVFDIKKQDSNHKLSRVIAGYAWPWKTKDGSSDYDIEIDGIKLVWNSTNIDWINSKNSVNEVGCIHTIQGYDLNYAGIIIGPELTYDKNLKCLAIDEKKYMDMNGKRSAGDSKELRQYILNIYKTLLTRGIKGTYVYVVDENLRTEVQKLFIKPETTKDKILNFVDKAAQIITVKVPLVGSAPCGNPILSEENILDYIEVPADKIKTGYNYFILKAIGDSMNLAGINDGDLVLCRQQIKAYSNDRVVALLGDNVTIKMYDKQNGRRVLLPKSSNPVHKMIFPEDGDSVQGIVQDVLFF